ncbi:alpha/beta hydrolase [Frankia sp. AiPs1]|uniref:alpha/beta hydrolase n=1 Tax=Frankia sp. AiPs1 TaxID=573493 RepID=UPI002044541D|nr:alpha/beta hydrolase [Frankia sp. AiPs1]MCM3924608.1 alpha/beta hydrolase [Frankia sp. AiPs1]
MPVEGSLADALSTHRPPVRPLGELPRRPGVSARELRVPGPPQAPPVLVRIYRPEGATGALPAVLWLHGGAFVLGNIDHVHGQAAEAALFAEAVVIAVGYRLAPEHPYPAALEDCLAVLSWAAEHADELGADPTRLAVAGTSAGATLAAGLALLIRDRGGPTLRLQHLVTPAFDDRLTTPSMVASDSRTPIWNRTLAQESWRLYLGDTPGPTPAYAAPARAEDLRGLPRTYLSVAGRDPLRDEALEYGLRLAQAGVAVELHHFPDAQHGFAGPVTELDRERIAIEHLATLRAAIHQPTLD